MTSEENILKNMGYTLRHQLAGGVYAKVYLAEYKLQNEENAVQLACKILDTQKTTKRIIEKFIPRELRILAKINHPYLIQVHSIFYRKMKFYIFMRFTEEGDLLEYILKHGTIQRSQARIWTRQMALGIQYLHILGIAHRDLKCENILLTANHNVKLTDFGFATFTPENTLSETYCGSTSYASPEILKGEPYDAKLADIWSFGIVIFIMLNKAKPFGSRNLKLLHEEQLQRKWRHRMVHECKLEEVISLLDIMLEPDVSKRCKIEDVLSSSWIAMDPNLKVLSPSEFEALSEAMEEAKTSRPSINREGRECGRFSMAMKKINQSRNTMTFFKQHDGRFDLQRISYSNKVQEGNELNSPQCAMKNEAVEQQS